MKNKTTQKKVCLNCMYLCSMGNNMFKCSSPYNQNPDRVMDLNMTLDYTCSKHSGTKKNNNTVFYQ